MMISENQDGVSFKNLKEMEIFSQTQFKKSQKYEDSSLSYTLYLGIANSSFFQILKV